MTAGRGRPAPVFDHLEHLTDERGLFEHAAHSTPRREHGYCVDDAARGLVVVCREPKPTEALQRLEQCYLDFVLMALDPDGSCHNRMDVEGHWHDDAAVGDWWGRALWGLGVAAARASTEGRRAQALSGFLLAAQRRSPHRRSMAFAALGAAEVLGVQPTDGSAQDLLVEAVRCIGHPGPNPDWPWPEARLTYGNGAIVEALIVAGAALADTQTLDRGLLLLRFLLRVETRDGQLSVTPTAGRGRGEVGPGYDQQPIEAAALADACASAYRATLDPRWLKGIRLAWGWFLGQNDSATPMFDASTGGGYDGLEPTGRNENQGAESTLAMLSTAQHVRRVNELR